MSPQKAAWPPQVGDHVQIVATGASGIVMPGSDRRNFVVAIYSHILGAATDAPHRVFSLREIGPDAAPSSEIRTATGANWKRGGTHNPLV